MDEQGDSRQRLEQFINAESAALHRTLRHYVLRAGLVGSGDANAVAAELLNEITVEALSNAKRLTPDIQPRAWLLGIAANLIKREQASRAKRERREPLIRDLYTESDDSLSEDELFDLLPTLPDGAIGELEANDTINSLLLGLTKSDSDLLRLAILNDMDGAALAQALGITANAARVRLHRALDRLREVHRVGGNYE